MTESEVHYAYTESPLGIILVATSEHGLTHVSFQEGTNPVLPHKSWAKDHTSLQPAIEQIRDYFYGELKTFDLPLSPNGTDFQKKVWAALNTIPCGETTTYGDLAKQLNDPTATRAIASANAKNPLLLIVPCHRVIGNKGDLRGYADGLDIKAALLQHEEKTSDKPRQMNLFE